MKNLENKFTKICQLITISVSCLVKNTELISLGEKQTIINFCKNKSNQIKLCINDFFKCFFNIIFELCDCD